MKKKLNEAGITNELRGNSAYFQVAPVTDDEPATEIKTRKRSAPVRQPVPVAPSASDEPEAGLESALTESALTDSALTPVMPDLAPHPSAEARPAPRAPNQDQLLETIRKAVKQLGKEATFCRFTQEEKNTLADVIYTYKRSGTRTSENEVIRIAVNWLLENYLSDGRNSVLAQVLEKLNA